MKTASPRPLAARLAAVALILVAAPVPAQTPDTLALVDAIFAQWDSPHAPGCAAAVSRHGTAVLSRAWGMADLEHGIPNTPATIFEAGSVSKQFTAAAVVLLAQRGLLSLDDDVRRYVPELPDYGTPITIRQLLNHTSGLRDWGSVAAIGGWPRGERTHTHDHVLDILARQRSLNYEPGAEYSYTNSGYNLAAVIVERVSGESFAAFSRRELFEPLGLASTQWRDDYRRIVTGRSTAYSMRDDAYYIDRPIEHVHGNGGLLTTVADLLTWNEALAGGRPGGAEYVAEMHRRGVLNDGTEIDYASGVVVGRYRGVDEVSHTGATSGYRAVLLRYPASGTGVAVLCNAGNVNPGAVGRRIADIYLGPTLEPVAATRVSAAEPSPPAPPADLVSLGVEPEEYAGEYHSAEAEATITVVARGGRLEVRRRPGGALTLTPVERDVFASSIGRLRFVRDEGGRVVQLSVSEARVRDLRFDRRDPARHVTDRPGGSSHE